MDINSTYYIKKLEALESYLPVWVNISPRLRPSIGSPSTIVGTPAGAKNGAGHYDQRPIHKFLVAKNTVTGLFIRIWTVGDTDDSKYVDVPSEAFLLGHEYYMYVRKYDIVNAAGATQSAQYNNLVLIGYSPKNIPFDL